MPWTLLADGTFKGLSEATIPAILGNPLAKFYLSGDGHRKPPFQWAVRQAVQGHFLALMGQQRLCLHVEQLPEQVNKDSIPPLFAPLIQQQKVFGWELSMFRDLFPAMELCLDIVDKPNPPLSWVVTLDREMLRINGLGWKVGNPPWMHAAVVLSTAYRQYWQIVNVKPAIRNKATDKEYQAFLLQYHNDAMQLRIVAHNFIGANITRVITQYPNDTHLITVGDAHITTNPVQQYINIDGQVGLVDSAQG